MSDTATQPAVTKRKTHDFPSQRVETQPERKVKPLRLAYLTTRYPAVSHTFIRRELIEIERRGHRVLRLSIRKADAAPIDPFDQQEQTQTFHCLSQPLRKILGGLLRTLATRPATFVLALRMALQMAWRSNRGLIRHLAYLVEAAFLLQVLRRNKVEHVHVHFGTNAAAVARLIRRLGGPSYSFTVHGPDEFDAPISLNLPSKINDAAFVVAISDFCSAQLRRWASFDDWAKIHVVQCTVTDAFFQNTNPIQANSNRLVCVGRLCPQKGQLLLIDALAQIVRDGMDVHLVLAGDGEMRPILEDQIRENALADYVTITGWIDEAEVRRQILAARALVLPSFAEGLPVVLMEAMALQRPVISTYVAGIPELVRQGENGWLVPAGNKEQLARCMKAALQAPTEQLNVMGANGRRHVRERHDVHTQVSRLDALFTHYVNKHPAS